MPRPQLPTVRSGFPTLGLVTLLAAACGDGTEQAPGGAPRPTSRPTGETIGPPREPVLPLPQGSSGALSLARKVVDHAGGPDALGRIRNIVFTYRANRVHDRVLWDLESGRVRVENLWDWKIGDPKVKWFSCVYDLWQDRDLIVGGGHLRGEQPSIHANQYWANHTWVLFFPLKVLDRGIELAIEPVAAGDPEGVRRLRLRFCEGTGFERKPLHKSEIHIKSWENQHLLHVQTATGKVLQWDYMAREGAPVLRWLLADWTEIGPLFLPLARRLVGTDTPLTIEDVALDVQIPGDAWKTHRIILTGVR